MNIDPNEQAFPCLESPEYHPISGLTVRAHFAIEITKALRSDHNASYAAYVNSPDNAWSAEKAIAVAAIRQADALINELNK